MAQRLIDYLLKNQVIFALTLIAGGWFLLQIRSVIVSIFVSYIIMAALLPFVAFLIKKGIPKLVAVIAAYISVLSLLVLLIFPLLNVFISQIQSLILNFPEYLDQSATSLGIQVNEGRMEEYLARELDSIGRNAFFVTRQVFGGVFSTLTILIVSFYLLLDHDTFKKWIANLFKKEDRPWVLQTLREVDFKLGAWMRGQVTLSIFIGVITWILLSLLDLPNALPLALLAGMLEIIPTLGPIIAAIPAIIIALTVSPTLAVTVIVAYIFIQLLENNILVPKIMQRAVGLNPIIVIIAVSTGASLMGVAGALLSIPFISFLIVLFNAANDNE